MHIASKSWHNVIENNTVNYFQKCGFAVPSSDDSQNKSMSVTNDEASIVKCARR